jgi:hypothetical protein
MVMGVFDSRSGIPVATPGIHGGLVDREAIANRAPRYAFTMRVRFRSPDGLMLGETVDMSASGMLVRFDHPVEVWLAGELSTFVLANLTVRVKVMRSDDRVAGLAFLIRSDADRAAVKELMAVAMAQGEMVAPMPCGCNECLV